MMIRLVGIEAAETLAVLHQECFSKYWNKKEFEQIVSVSGTQVYMAETTEAAGAIICRTLHEQSEIITMMTRPALRRGGIGKALLNHAMAQAAQAGAKRMFLEVDEGNEAARELYEKAGFAVISRRKDYYRQPDSSFADALVMASELD